MALYTRLTPEEIQDLVRPYGLEKPLKTKGILEGTVNTYYRLTYPDRALYLKIDEVAQKARLQRELKILDLLESIQKKLGFKTPIPLKTLKGRFFVPYHHKYALLFPEIHGNSFTVGALKATHLAQMGDAMARLHRATQGGSLPPHRFHLQEHFRVYGEVLDRLKKKHPSIAAGVQKKLKELKANEPGNPPKGLIHADLFPENVLFVGNRLEGILDFEAAGSGAFLFDICVFIHACCHDRKHFLLPRIRTFLKAYEKVRPLTVAEHKQFEYYMHQSAMRFLLTRLRDFELKEGKVKAKPFKDYRDYWKRFDEIEGLIKKIKILITNFSGIPTTHKKGGPRSGTRLSTTTQ